MAAVASRGGGKFGMPYSRPKKAESPREAGWTQEVRPPVPGALQVSTSEPEARLQN